MAEEAVLQNLSTKLLVEIFSYLKIKDLCKAALVSKQFKELSYSNGLWEGTTLKCRMKEFIDEDIVPSLMQKGIRRLTITPNDQDMKVQKCQKLLPVLEYLYLDLLHLAGNPLAKIIAVTKGVDFSALKELAVDFFFFEESKDNGMLEELLEQFPNLEHLRLFQLFNKDSLPKGWEEKCNKELEPVFGKLRKLRKLEIGFGSKAVPFPDVQLHQWDSLEELLIHLMPFDGVTMQAVGQCFPKLRILGFKYCTYTGKHLAEECCKYLDHLQELEFCCCENIAEKEINNIKQMAEDISNLKYVKRA